MVFVVVVAVMALIGTVRAEVLEKGPLDVGKSGCMIMTVGFVAINSEGRGPGVLGSK